MKNLNFVVQNYRLARGIVSTQYDQTFLQHAINGLKEMKAMGLYQEAVKAVELIINKEHNTATLPEDYNADSLIRLGICRNGVFINFDKNDALCLPSEKDCACPTQDEMVSQIESCCNGTFSGYGWWVYPIYGNPYSWSYNAGNQSIGPGNYKGGYKIDYAKRLIQFDKCVTVDTCILEYFGDVVNDAGNAIVSEQMQSVLFNYIHYCVCRFSPDAAMRREAPMAYNTYYQKVRDLNSNQQALTKSDWLQLMRRYVYLNPKA